MCSHIVEPRPAVVEKGHGPRRRWGILLEISHVEHARRGWRVGGLLDGRRIDTDGGVGIVGRTHQDGPSDGLVVDGVAANVDRALSGGVLGDDGLCIRLGGVLGWSIFRWGIFAGFLRCGRAKPQGAQKQQAQLTRARKERELCKGDRFLFDGLAMLF